MLLRVTVRDSYEGFRLAGITCPLDKGSLCCSDLSRSTEGRPGSRCAMPQAKDTFEAREQLIKQLLQCGVHGRQLAVKELLKCGKGSPRIPRAHQLNSWLRYEEC